MVCKKHGNRQAVAQCKNCGAYICDECMSKTAALSKETGVLCTDCYNDLADDLYNYYAAQRKKKITSAIVSIVFYIIGIICLTLSETVGMFMTLIGVVLMGFFPAISWYKFAGKSIDDYDAKHGATYVITDSGVERDRGIWLRIIFFVLGIVFGVFITPINVIRWLVGAAKDKKDMRACADSRLPE